MPAHPVGEGAAPHEPERRGHSPDHRSVLGLGAEYAARLATTGHDLVLTARRGDRLEALAAELRNRTGVDVETLQADLALPDDLRRVTERVRGEDLTLLVNNAGINGYGLFGETDPDLLTKVLAVNVTALTTLARAAVPGMLARGRGSIVNVASQLAFAGSLPPDPLPERAVYAGTKGYVVTFTRTLAAELGDAPTVQVLCPGLTATEFHLTAGEQPVPGLKPLVHDVGGMPRSRRRHRLAGSAENRGDRLHPRTVRRRHRRPAHRSGTAPSRHGRQHPRGTVPGSGHPLTRDSARHGC